MSVTKADLIEALKSLIFPDTKMREALREAIRPMEMGLLHLYPPIRSDKPVLSPGAAGQWDAVNVHSGYVFRDYTGNWYLYYNGQLATTSGIGLATSLDGYVFTKHAANPLLTPVPGTWETRLWKSYVYRLLGDNPVFRMWYGGYGTDLHYRVGYAYSADGVVWTKYAGNPVLGIGPADWDSHSVLCLKVAYDAYAAQYIGLYIGTKSLTGLEHIYSIGLAYSPDGVTWSKYSENPVMISSPNSWESRELGAFNLSKRGDLWTLFYEAMGFMSNYKIGVAYSENLVDWWRDPRNPILGPGYTGDFDDVFVSDPCVVVHPDEPDVIRLYYGTRSTNGSDYYGLALIPLRPKINGYFRTNWSAWNARVLGAGETSDMITCGGYSGKTIYFLSSANGTLTIRHREPDGGWEIYDTVAVVAATPVVYPLGGDVEALRISFSAIATVTARWVLTA